MAASTFIIVPDHPSAPRLEVRPKHFSKIAAEESNPETASASRTLMGGAYLAEQPRTLDATTWGFEGSALVLELPEGAGEEGAKEWLRTDPYSAGGVWDWEKARIIKFRAGVSNPQDLSAGK
ncbi:hypothetical protein H072_10840 [Dactylellina haptotyla CBS 200.50]|uniref:YCII-related domain-containing protein n=1 Tax=Dactylellina haptotyla (strain CBS 200.50) TaxID=1284197 RepID=S8BKD0_DACHA|nr:hypothetical protein H072_10840 [Dactylellina haptotyla CBS 200.50]